MPHLLKAALHGLVGEECDGPHEVSDEDEVSLCLEVQGDDTVEVTTLYTQLLLRRPLKQSHLAAQTTHTRHSHTTNLTENIHSLYTYFYRRNTVPLTTVLRGGIYCYVQSYMH